MAFLPPEVDLPPHAREFVERLDGGVVERRPKVRRRFWRLTLIGVWSYLFVWILGRMEGCW